jgi:hypothetical protein
LREAGAISQLYVGTFRFTEFGVARSNGEPIATVREAAGADAPVIVKR